MFSGGSPGVTGRASATVVPAEEAQLAAASLGFGISKDGLAEIVLEKDINVLARYGGLKGLVRKVKTDVEKGLRSETVRVCAHTRGWQRSI
jgi:hypothetical protein